jgi:hypothetical protein
MLKTGSPSGVGGAAATPDVVRQDLAREKGIVVTLRTVERAVAPLRQAIEVEGVANKRWVRREPLIAFRLRLICAVRGTYATAIGCHDPRAGIRRRAVYTPGNKRGRYGRAQCRSSTRI